MKKLVCECCGSSDIVKVSDEFYQCESCGVKYQSETVSKLLKDIVEEAVGKDRPKLEDIVSNAQRNLKSGNWKQAYRSATEALHIESEHPEALLCAGVAAGMENPWQARQTFVYVRDAIESKQKREESGAYAFVSEALEAAWLVYRNGLEKLVNDTYKSSFSEHQTESKKERAQQAQEAYRRAVSRGERYTGPAAAVGVVDTAFDAIMARNDAAAIRRKYQDEVLPELERLTDTLLPLAVRQLSDAGLQALCQLLPLQYGQKPKVSYNHRAAQKQAFETRRERFLQWKEETGSAEARQTFGRMAASLEKAIEEIDRLDRNGPPGALLTKRQMILCNLLALLPMIGWILLFVAVLFPYLKMKKAGYVLSSDRNEQIPFTAQMQSRRKAQNLLCMIVTAVCSVLRILLYALIS